MAKTSTNPDITVRGGTLNVPHSTTPTHPPRHQPDTPRTKKQPKTRPDHIIPDPAAPPLERPTSDPAAPPLERPTTEPAADPPA